MCVKWSSEESKPKSSTRRTIASLMYNKYEPYNVMQMVDIIYGPLWRDHPIIVSITSIFAIYINLRFVSSKMVDVLCIQLWNMHIEHNEHNCVLDSWWSKTHPWGLGHVCFSAINFNDFHFVVCEAHTLWAHALLHWYDVCERAFTEIDRHWKLYSSFCA